jgi:FlaA1/EpsC-like NDP-sugar epimerase
LLSFVARDSFEIVIPWLTLAVGGLLSFLMMGLVRFRSRLFSFKKHGEGLRYLIVGSGPDSAAFARRIQQLEKGGSVVGFVSNNGTSERLLADLPVLGGLADVPALVIEHSVDQVVVVGGGPERISAVVDSCLEIDVRLSVLPDAESILRSNGSSRDVRDIRVEDLLVRDPVATDMSMVNMMLTGKTVLVTGGGGSIGSEIVRQVLEYQPRAVWALDRDETLLHEARLSWPGAASVVLGDIRDAEATLRTFERIRPDVVFHAAALKHVPVLEDYPEEAVLTNVVGTQHVIEAGSRVGVSNFVLVSTDKAVDPASVMGASKRVAELLVKAGNERRDGCTYTAVRFGNVLGSRGSVIPTFVSQIRDGGPVTVTDPEMTRYFMTVDEAVQLVLQAGALARGSEVFILDMGEPVRIADLARRLIRLAGLIPDVDIEILYTGIRPGEKLVESLADGPLDTTSNPKINEVPLAHPGAMLLAEAVAELEDAALGGRASEVVRLLEVLASGSLSDNRAMQTQPDRQLRSSWS